MKDKKNWCDTTVIFPDKSALAHVFWLIILNCPAGFVIHTIMMILSEGFEFLLIARTGFEIQIIDKFINNVYESSSFSGIILGILIAVIAFYLLNLLIIWYLYRVVKK